MKLDRIIFSLIYHAVQLVSNDVIDEMSLSMLSKKNIMYHYIILYIIYHSLFYFLHLNQPNTLSRSKCLQKHKNVQLYKTSKSFRSGGNKWGNHRTCS